MATGRGFRALPLISRYAFFISFRSHSNLSFFSVTDLYFFDSGQILSGLSIAPPPVREEWRPTLQHVSTSGGESRVAAVRPSPPRATPS